MKRTKIAPVLTALLDDLATLARNPKRSRPADARVVAFAARDLRALLAVARAVGKGVAHTDWCGSQVAEECCCPSQDAVHALARLDRLSRRDR